MNAKEARIEFERQKTERLYAERLRGEKKRQRLLDETKRYCEQAGNLYEKGFVCTYNSEIEQFKKDFERDLEASFRVYNGSPSFNAFLRVPLEEGQVIKFNSCRSLPTDELMPQLSVTQKVGIEHASLVINNWITARMFRFTPQSLINVSGGTTQEYGYGHNNVEYLCLSYVGIRY